MRGQYMFKGEMEHCLPITYKYFSSYCIQILLFISGAIAGGTARLVILLIHNWVKSLNLVPSG